MSAELVVLGTRGRGRARSALIGSVSYAVVAHAYCPVVVLHDVGRPAHDAHLDLRIPGTNREVVCALSQGDGEAHAARAGRIVSAAARIADACAAPLRLVTVVGGGGVSDVAAQRVPYAVASLTSRHPGLVVTVESLDGDPVPTLVETSRRSGLLVVGAPHRGGVTGVLAGDSSYRLIHDATCPVMLVP
jgi:nucleotide-binding universal stress UspA family protein